VDAHGSDRAAVAPPRMFPTFRKTDTTRQAPRNRRNRLGRFVTGIASAVVLSLAAVFLVAGGTSRSATAAEDESASRVASSAGVALEGIARGDDVQINLGRHLLAAAVAEQSGAAPEQLETAWIESGLPREAVVYTALAQVGVMYRSNGEAPDEGFDCSGLTKYAWSAAGLLLDHNDATQISDATSVGGLALAHPGDLVQWPGHVMLYLGVDDVVVHAFSSGRPVSVGRVGSHRVVYADPLG
jgi:peptidoglycan DL-endopeptidase CwlO